MHTVTTPQRLIILLLSLLLLTACGRTAVTNPTATPASVIGRSAAASPTPPATETVATAPPTSLPAPSSTPTPTPSATPVPTATPRPTATAVPLTVVGDPRSGLLATPAPSGSAPCGVVDVLDFPLNPPDGVGVRGGQDFGVFRSRYDKYHAGEDWWHGRGGASFGEPVYSIGHGLVTYAEPEGWNRDKGVVIVRHTFSDGRSVLSFYGHLDPPSVTVQPGTCVARGEQIGQIGRPRSSPHLHFEIRTQSAYAPLTGYWTEDPTEAGWLPPSQFIWGERIAAAPGVQWTRPFTGDGTRALGVTNDDTLLILEDGQLLGLDVAGGDVRWQHAGESDVAAGLLDANRSLVYLANRGGEVTALALASKPATRWTRELDDVVGTPLLLPLPEGGVAVAARHNLYGLDAAGDLLWTRHAVGQPLAWTRAGEQLLLATTAGAAPLWQIDAAGPRAWNAPAGATPLLAGGQVWLYGRDGLYRLAATRTAVLHYPLPPGLTSLGDAVALTDGGVLLAHADRFDRRLLAFGADGALRWERSYDGRLHGRVRLLATDNAVYVVNEQENADGASALSVYALDLESATLTQIFAGGTRAPNAADTWLLADGERLLLNIGGGHMVALTPREALP